MNNNNPIKLVYRGKYDFLEDGRMWDIMTPSHPSYKSTFMLNGLIELGVVPKQYWKESKFKEGTI